MNDVESAVEVCAICNGPIYQGEPVVVWDIRLVDGISTTFLAHRFSTWCKHYQDKNAEFMKGVGITLRDAMGDLDSNNHEPGEAVPN